MSRIFAFHQGDEGIEANHGTVFGESSREAY